MIGFLVRTAVRGATHAAIQSHRESQRQAEALRAQMQAFPFTLTPKAHDVMLYTDVRNGFGHLVPGRPQLTPAMPGHGEPPDDTALWLSDLPVTIRYRFAGAEHAAVSAADLAGRSADDHVRRRTQNTVNPAVEMMHPEWLVTWAVEAAARASYDLPYPDAMGADHEELFVLVLRGAVMRITVRYPKAAIDPVTSAVFMSAFEASMSFQPGRFQNVPAVWPESTFLEPWVVPTLRQFRLQQVAQLTPTLRIAQDEKASLFGALENTLKNAGAPWLALDGAAWQRHKDVLLGAARDPNLRGIIDASFADVRTAQDVRGLAMVVGRAVEGATRPSSFAPPAM